MSDVDDDDEIETEDEDEVLSSSNRLNDRPADDRSPTRPVESIHRIETDSRREPDARTNLPTSNLGATDRDFVLRHVFSESLESVDTFSVGDSCPVCLQNDDDSPIVCL